MRSCPGSSTQVDFPPAHASFFKTSHLGARNKGSKPEKPYLRIPLHEHVQEDIRILGLVGVEECERALQPSSTDITCHIRLEEDAVQEGFNTP